MRKITLLIVLLGLLFMANSAFAGDFFTRNPVEISDVSPTKLKPLVDMKIDIDKVTGSTVRAYVTNEEFATLSVMGYSIRWIPNEAKIAHDALLEATKNTRDLMGDYHTYDELTADLRALVAAHPALCHMESAGQSVQGRDLWWIKISDNVTVEENEPEINFIAGMHGDEVVGIETSLALIHYLVDNYGTNSRVTQLVNDTEIWIMPSMNPDGTKAGSRYNASGVDLNRDFPDFINDPNNTTTGRAPETKCIMNWIRLHTPTLSANFHGGALVVNYPWDCTRTANPDKNLFIKISEAYSSKNSPMWNGEFTHGITEGAAWYMVNGGMQDWHYYWHGCNEVTIELSNDKWPSASTLPGFWEDNREAMLAYMEQAQMGVRGLVTDAGTGLPIAAKVRVQGIDHAVFTDPDVGDYHRMLLPGTYTLIFEADGHTSVTVPGVVVASGSATVKNVQLGGGSSTYPLTVNSGSGNGNYAANATATITANAAPTGQVFDRWVANTGNPTIASVTSVSTTLKMPTNAAAVTATYRAITSTNVALNRSATASSTYSASYIPSYAVDGNPSTYWASAALSSATTTQWLAVDLQNSYGVNQATIQFSTSNYPKAWSIQYQSGSTWTNAYSASNNTSGGIKTVNFTAVTARNFRVYMTSSAGNYYVIYDLQLFGSTSSNYTLTTAASPTSGGTITCSPNATSYAPGTVVTLTATPATSYTFSGWSGNATGTSSTTQVTMDGNKTVTANFAGSVNPTTYNEAESNDSLSAANAVPDTATKIVATIGTSTDKDYFKVNVGSGVTLKVDMTGPAKDYDMYLYNSSGTQLASSTGSTATETLSYKNTGTSTTAYTIYVKGYNGATSTTPYNLALTKSGTPGVVTVTINPTTASIAVNTTKQFAANVTGTTNTAVTWTCTGGGTVNNGLYTAPTTACNATVKATSVADSTKSASATVTVSSTTTYALTVNSGSGSGNYPSGATATITANAAPSGQVFDKWTINTGNPQIANVAAVTTTLTMPTNAASVTATYKNGGGGKTFIVSAVNDGLDTADLYLMADGLKSLGYTQDTLDMNTSSAEMISYMGKNVTTYYHTGHGGNGGLVATSDGTITDHSGPVNAVNTFWATCLTVGDTGWKTAMGPNAQNVMGYTNYSWDAPTDDDVVKALIAQLKNGKSYPMSWYLANVGISDVADRWISYTRVGSSIVEYSARTATIPTSRTDGTWEALGDTGRMWIAPGLLDHATQTKTPKSELRAEPAEGFDYVAPGEFSLLTESRMSRDQAVTMAKQWLSGHHQLPSDAVLSKVVEIGRRTDAQKGKALAGHMVVFTRLAQGQKVCGNGIQDHLVVMVSSQGVVSVSSYWPQITETASTDPQPLLTARQAIERAVPGILRILKNRDLELFFDQVNPVWGTRGLYGTDRRLVPAYELRSNDGSSFIIDARDGNLISK